MIKVAYFSERVCGGSGTPLRGSMQINFFNILIIEMLLGGIVQASRTILSNKEF